MQFLFNAAIAIAAILVILTLWGGVHLLARKRMGDRKIGCRGPMMDETGRPVCCNSADPCAPNEDLPERTRDGESREPAETP